MKRILVVLSVAGLSVSVAWSTGWVAAQSGAATSPKVYKNLEMSVTGVERAPNASLNDCPPGANSQRSTARGEEEFAIVTLKVKVLPGYKPEPLKKPTMTDSTGKVFNTAVSFVDVGKVPEFSCAIPFRVPNGTSVKTLQVDTLTFDIAALDAKR